MPDQEDLVSRSELAERVEGLSEKAHSKYKPGTEGETAYIHAVDDALEKIEKFPED